MNCYDMWVYPPINYSMFIWESGEVSAVFQVHFLLPFRSKWSYTYILSHQTHRIGTQESRYDALS